MHIVIETRKLSKDYRRDKNPFAALKNVDLQVACGEFLALMGPSGSGKSTLLHLIAAMDRPSNGEVLVLEAGSACTEQSPIDAMAQCSHRIRLSGL